MLGNVWGEYGHRTCVVGEAGWLGGCGLPNLPCRISVASLTLRMRSSVPCRALCALFWAPFLEGQDTQKKVGRFSPRRTAGCLHELHLKPLNTDILKFCLLAVDQIDVPFPIEVLQPPHLRPNLRTPHRQQTP
jgi:hypothetical protein